MLDARAILRSENLTAARLTVGWIPVWKILSSSLKAEHPGETEASKSQADGKQQHSGSASFRLTNSCCDEQQDRRPNDCRQGNKKKEKRQFQGRSSIFWARNNTWTNVKTGGDSSIIREDDDNEDRKPWWRGEVKASSTDSDATQEIL